MAAGEVINRVNARSSQARSVFQSMVSLKNEGWARSTQDVPPGSSTGRRRIAEEGEQSVRRPPVLAGGGLARERGQGDHRRRRDQGPEGGLVRGWGRSPADARLGDIAEQLHTLKRELDGLVVDAPSAVDCEGQVSVAMSEFAQRLYRALQQRLSPSEWQKARDIVRDVSKEEPV